MGKTVLPLFLSCFDRALFILAGNDDIRGSVRNTEPYLITIKSSKIDIYFDDIL